MISHKYKCIFIHIPKTAGTSIYSLFTDIGKLDWKQPNYDVLFGWCPKRKMHLQHATPQQLIETDLISEADWKNYYKFTFVRNPWDKSFSDYFWMMKDRKVKDSFKNYITASGDFDKYLNKPVNMEYRGDHLLPQIEFLKCEKFENLDFVGRFENLNRDMEIIRKKIGMPSKFDQHLQKNIKKHSHYSKFYNNSRKKLVIGKYKEDIHKLGYGFEDQKNLIEKLIMNFR